MVMVISDRVVEDVKGVRDRVANESRLKTEILLRLLAISLDHMDESKRKEFQEALFEFRDQVRTEELASWVTPVVKMMFDQHINPTEIYCHLLPSTEKFLRELRDYINGGGEKLPWSPGVR